MLCLLISPLELIQPREKNLHVLVEYVRFERRLKFPKLVCYHYTTYSILKQTIVNSPSTMATYLISPFRIRHSDITVNCGCDLAQVQAFTPAEPVQVPFPLYPTLYCCVCRSPHLIKDFRLFVITQVIILNIIFHVDLCSYIRYVLFHSHIQSQLLVLSLPYSFFQSLEVTSLFKIREELMVD